MSARALLAGGLILVIAASGCGGGGETSPGAAPSAGEVRVVATTSILGDVVRNVVGTAGAVQTLMGPGQDPHSFEASAKQAAALRDADLVVANGLGLEAGLEDALATAASEGVRVVHLAEAVQPIDEDPHFWTDPLRMAAAVRVLGSELARTSDALTPAEWDGRAAAYAGELERLDAEVAELLATVPPEGRKLVTNHDSLRYLADRYGYEVVGTVIPGNTTLAESSAGQLADLAALVRDEQVPAIFVETTQPSELAAAVADEAGVPVRVVELFTGALGEPGSGAETYIGFVREDAERIAAGLSGSEVP